MWLACLKYHPTFGIPGTELRGATLPEQVVDLGRGWEWWPSVLWQVIWTWIVSLQPPFTMVLTDGSSLLQVAPILLYRAWGIRDTMGWRIQTIGCCLSKLVTPSHRVSAQLTAISAFMRHQCF